MPTVSPLAVATLLAGLCMAPAVAAQVSLSGTVLDENSGLPLEGARVEILDVERRVRAAAQTDQNGRFRIEVRHLPGYRVRAVRPGFQTNATPILWTDGHSEIQIELRLDPSVVLLAPIEVVARSRRLPSPVFESFRHRQRSGIGTLITREEIANRGPGTVTDLLAGIPGVRLEAAGGSGLRRTVYMSRALSGPRNCPAQIFIDGFHLNRGNPLTGGDGGITIDDAVSPDAIEAIEVFRGVSGVPPEFLTLDSRCGVIAIWTRRGNA
jgi:hypothetical protein